MKAKEIMTRQVECVTPEMPVRDAAQLMQVSEIDFLPVCETDNLVGALTDRDIVVRCVAPGLDADRTPCRDIMTTDVFYCYEDQDIDEVASEMRDREVHRMVILDRKNKLAGVVSLGDISKVEGEERVVGKTVRDIAEAA